MLNAQYGLYEVVPGRIWQVRGFDISNITFVRGDTGWIVFDPLVSKETAAAALAFANEKLGARPVVAVVYSHSHIDHFGGVRGVIDEADVKAGKVQVIAPAGFMEAAISENVYAGNAMIRRAMYQYGMLLPSEPVRPRRPGDRQAGLLGHHGPDRADATRQPRTSRKSSSMA